MRLEEHFPRREIPLPLPLRIPPLRIDPTRRHPRRAPCWNRIVYAVPAFSVGTTAAATGVTLLQTASGIAVPAGATVVIHARIGAIGRTITVTSTIVGDAWPGTAAAVEAQTTDGHEANVFTLGNSLGGTAQFTVAISGAAASIRFEVLVYTGASATAALDGTGNKNQAVSAAGASGTATTANANSILLSLHTGDGSQTATVAFAGSPGGTTTLRESISTFIYASDIVAPGTTGTYGATATWAASNAWTAIYLAILPATASASGTAAIAEGTDTVNAAGQAVAFPAGFVSEAVQTSLYTGSGFALSQIASPSSAIGDIWGTTVSSPGGYLVPPQGDSTVIEQSGGDNSRQSFQAMLYRSASKTFDGPVTGWINEVPPIWNGPIALPGLQLGVAMTPVNLNAYVVSTEGDTLTFSIATGGLPPGLSLSSAGLITGTPTSIAGQGNTASFPVSFFATDNAGSVGTTQSPGTSFTVFGQSAPPDNIRVRTPRQRSRTQRTGTRPQVPDWQSLSKMEAEKVRRIDRKLRGLRNAPAAQREQVLEDELHAALPASAAYHPAPMAAGPVPHTDDQDIARILADEHRQILAFAHHVLKVLGS